MSRHVGLLVDLKVSGWKVCVVGGGKEGLRKASGFLEAGAKVYVIGERFSKGFLKLEAEGRVRLFKRKVENLRDVLDTVGFKPRLLLIATDDHELNRRIALEAGDAGMLVYVVDEPRLSDLSRPAVARILGGEVAVSTGGKSPLMARALKRRIEKALGRE